jgi:hypothetical protein
VPSRTDLSLTQFRRQTKRLRGRALHPAQLCNGRGSALAEHAATLDQACARSSCTLRAIG